MFGNARRDRSLRMSSRTRARTCRELRVDRARDLVARRQLVDEPLAASRPGAGRPRRAPPRSRGSRPALRRPGSAVGWNCTNSMSARAAPASCASIMPGADRAARVRRARPQRGRAAGREHGRARLQPAPTSVRAPAQRPSSHPQPERAAALAHLDPLVRPDDRRQRRGDVAAGRAAAGVHDPPPCVAAFERQLQLPVGRSGRSGSRAPRARAPGRATRAQRTVAAERRDRAAARTQRVLEVQLDGVVAAPAPRPGRPAPSSSPTAPAASARRGRPRPPARRRPARCRGRPPRRRSPSTSTRAARSCAVSWCLHGAVPYPARARPPPCRSPLPASSLLARARHRATIPSARSGSWRSSRSWSAADGWAAGARRRRTSTGRCWRRCTRAAYVDSIARASARAGGGMLDADTVASPGSWEAALHSAGGAARAVGRAAGAARREVAFCGLRPPGPPRRGGPGDGLLPVQQRGRRRAARARRPRTPSACWCSTGTSTTATARTTSSTTPTGSCTSSIHQSPLYPGTGPLTDNGSGRGRGLHRQPAGAAGDRPRGVAGAGAARGRARSRARTRPDLVLVSAGFDAHRDDPLANCLLTEETYAAMAAAMRDARARAGRAAAASARGRLRPRRAGARRSRRRSRPHARGDGPPGRSVHVRGAGATARRALRAVVAGPGRRLSGQRPGQE